MCIETIRVALIINRSKWMVFDDLCEREENENSCTRCELYIPVSLIFFHNLNGKIICFDKCTKMY